ncbi:MAG: polysaccharide export protein [Verrucomicrobia bacterium]|nr:polysaccharide export protein [Verrucomicrobiota bacterium]
MKQMSSIPSAFALPLFMFAVIFCHLPSADCQDAASPSETSDYRLASDDLLDFRVFQEPELDSVVRVSGDGIAQFPLIGSVSIGGKTISEAILAIENAYRDGYLKNPQASLTIRAYAKKLFTILGQVQQPGSYDMQGNNRITLLQAIGMAGGYTKIADPANVTVKRQDEGSEKLLKFNAKRMARGDEDSSFFIKAGDVISVGESLF